MKKLLEPERKGEAGEKELEEKKEEEEKMKTSNNKNDKDDNTGPQCCNLLYYLVSTFALISSKVMCHYCSPKIVLGPKISVSLAF